MVSDHDGTFVISVAIMLSWGGGVSCVSTTEGRRQGRFPGQQCRGLTKTCPIGHETFLDPTPFPQFGGGAPNFAFFFSLSPVPPPEKLGIAVDIYE